MPIDDATWHGRLEPLPGRVAHFADTDPEWTGLLDHWAFHDVSAQDGPEVKTRLMLPLAALIAGQSINAFHYLLDAVTQWLPCIGCPRALNAIGAIDEATGNMAS